MKKSVEGQGFSGVIETQNAEVNQETQRPVDSYGRDTVRERTELKHKGMNGRRGTGPRGCREEMEIEDGV